MIRQLIALAVWSFCGVVAASAQSPAQEDPFEEYYQAHERAEATWQEAHRNLASKLASSNPCRDDYRNAIAQVRALMEASFAANKEYLSVG